MNQRKSYAVVVLVGLLVAVTATFWPGDAGAATSIREHTIYAGSCDSTEQASLWIPIRGAKRVFIRCWSRHSAFAANCADTLYSDSLAAVRFVFADSVKQVWEYSVGVSESVRVPVGIDTLAVEPGAVDTTAKMVGVAGIMVNKALRSEVNGGGLYSAVYPVYELDIDGAGSRYDDVFRVGYMRVRFTPLRRFVALASELNTPRSVNGLKSFKMVAYIVRDE